MTQHATPRCPDCQQFVIISWRINLGAASNHKPVVLCQGCAQIKLRKQGAAEAQRHIDSALKTLGLGNRRGNGQRDQGGGVDVAA